MEGDTAWIVNPQPGDASQYSYGATHALLEGVYGRKASLNHTRVEGYDVVSASAVVVHSFDWESIGATLDRLEMIEDRNLGTVSEAGERGAATIRKAAVDAQYGHLVVPVNCGQQLCDVIDVTDIRAGVIAAKKRVVGIRLVYEPDKGRYLQRLLLAAV